MSCVCVCLCRCSDPNALRATEIPDVMSSLSEMDETLTRIQKSLDQYLEKKRQAFPRFYFLSSEDLLEILGQSRGAFSCRGDFCTLSHPVGVPAHSLRVLPDPNAVQKHLKKCFDAIHRLRIEDRDGGRGVMALEMLSPEGEKMDLYPSPVQLDHKPVEDWMKEVSC